MGNKFLYSGGGNVPPYETPANSATTLKGLIDNSVVAAGEIIWVKSDHNEINTTANQLWTAEGGVPVNPLRVLCTSDWTLNPSTISSGGMFTTSRYNADTVGSFLFYGVSFVANLYYTTVKLGTNNSTANPNKVQAINCYFEACNHSTGSCATLGLDSAGSSSRPPLITLKNPVIKCQGSSNPAILIGICVARITGLSISGSSATILALFRSSSNNIAVDTIISNSDLSNNAIIALVSLVQIFIGKITFVNCKLHPSTIVTNGSWDSSGGEVLLINCDSGDTHTRHERYGYEGTWKVTTTIFATTNPALMDGTVNYSIQMSSSATVGRNMPLYSQWMQVWNDGTAYTPSVEVLTLGLTALNSAELWLEVDYTSGTDSPLGTRTITCPDIITEGAAVASGTTSWVGAGSDTPQKLTSASITPTKPGYIYMRVALAKPSASVYVNPPR